MGMTTTTERTTTDLAARAAEPEQIATTNASDWAEIIGSGSDDGHYSLMRREVL